MLEEAVLAKTAQAAVLEERRPRVDATHRERQAVAATLALRFVVRGRWQQAWLIVKVGAAAAGAKVASAGLVAAGASTVAVEATE